MESVRSSFPLCGQACAYRGDPIRTRMTQIHVAGKIVKLDRFTVNGLAFGSEVLWLDGQGDLAALMTFSSGLPIEGGCNQAYEASFEELFKRLGVDQEMRTLAEALNRARCLR